MAVIPTLPLYIEQRFALTDPAQVRRWSGLIYGVAPLAAAFMGPLWGALGDRIGRRAMVLRSVIAIGIVMALMPLAPTPQALLALRILQGCFAGYVAPALSLVAASSPPERQGLLIARMQVALALGLLAGPVIGAEVAELFGRTAVFWVTSAAAFLAAVPILLFVREDRSTLAPKAAGHSFLGGFVHSMLQMLRSRVLLLLLLTIFALRFGTHMVEPYIVLWVRELGPLPFLVEQTGDVGHAIDRTTALAFAILAMAQLLVTPTWGRLADRFGPLLCLGLSALSLSVVLLVTSSVQTIQAYLGLRVAAAVFMAGMMTLAYASVAKRVPPYQKSLAFAIVQSCIQLGLSLGPMSGGAISSAHGLRALFTVAGCVALGAGSGMLLLRLVPAERAKVTATPIPEERA